MITLKKGKKGFLKGQSGLKGSKFRIFHSKKHRKVKKPARGIVSERHCTYF
jgi:hypothetical protein